MANKKQSNDLKASLEAVRKINWLDGIHQLPNDVDEKLLNQCSDLIQEFLEGSELSSMKIRKLKTKPKMQKRQASKMKKSKRKLTSEIPPVLIKSIEFTLIRKQTIQIEREKSQKKTEIFNHIHPLSAKNSPSAYPCFRPSGPISCPKNKLPMPRDLWYRIVYSQALEQQLGSGESATPRKDLSKSLSKRKRKEDGLEMKNLLENKSNSTNPRQQQTMNAAISSTINRKIEVDDQLQKSESSNSYSSFPKDQLECIAETFPLKIECKTIQFKENAKTVLSTQSAHVELLNRPKIYRGISADAQLERKNLSIGKIPSPSAPFPPIILPTELHSEPMTSSSIEPLPTNNLSIQEVMDKSTDSSLPPDSAILFDHPLINQLFQYYNLEDIPRLYLLKQLNRRLRHIRQSLQNMPLHDIELKLKYKRDALTKKRQTPVQSLTKDERIAMAELELNVYEYVQALDEPSSKSFHINDNDMLQTDQWSSVPPIPPFCDTVVPVVKSAMTSESSIVPSVSTFNTVQPSALSESTARLSTITQFSEPTDKIASWTHPLEAHLMTMFDSFAPSHKSQIHKQLARRYEHICKKAQELSKTQLQTQIDSKSKALEQCKRLSHPTKDELLRIAELELSLFELRHEQTQRNELDH